MIIAVEGCCHGELDRIYERVAELERRQEGLHVDLLIICGDFQAIRDQADLSCMACPPKYRRPGTFYQYYSGQKHAPIPTLFIGGNHEASNHLWELYFGGWVCPNIYFLGFSGVIWFGGLRIAGISGIYKRPDYYRDYTESLPYTESDLRSIYHVREYEIRKLAKLRQPIDIFLSHDWPSGIEQYGSLSKLLSRKPFLSQDIENGHLGNPQTFKLLQELKPRYWFSAHLHVKYVAVHPHTPSSSSSSNIHAKILSELESKLFNYSSLAVCLESDQEMENIQDTPTTTNTVFLSLDKCLPRRDYLQILNVSERKMKDAEGCVQDKCFYYDSEWCSILKKWNPAFPSPFNIHRKQFNTIVMDEPPPHSSFNWKDLVISQDAVFVQQKPVTFATSYATSDYSVSTLPNPQTEEFCTWLGIVNPTLQARPSMSSNSNREEIQLD